MTSIQQSSAVARTFVDGVPLEAVLLLFSHIILDNLYVDR